MQPKILAEIQNRTSLGLDDDTIQLNEDSSHDQQCETLFKTRLPLTAGLQQRRNEKLSDKKSKLF